MPGNGAFSRREFLKMIGGAASIGALGACTSCASKVVPATIPLEPTQENIEPIVSDMILVEAGSFEMGSTDGADPEKPIHAVEITRSFYIAKYAVTFEAYDRFCVDDIWPKPNDEGWGRGDRPVIHLSWDNAVQYCNWLSEKQGFTPCYSGKGKFTECDFLANGYRLPTEAEWEYAAHGGQKSRGYTYAGSDNIDDVAWYAGNSGGQTHPVGQKQPNELGLYDMSGNAGEWCWDWYGKDYYALSPSSDPTGPKSLEEGPYAAFGGGERVVRGGSFQEEAYFSRIVYRNADLSRGKVGPNGFRLVRVS